MLNNNETANFFREKKEYSWNDDVTMNKWQHNERHDNEAMRLRVDHKGQDEWNT